MLGLKIFSGILFSVMLIVMMSIMIVFERDKPKKIICWAIIFLALQLIGYALYLINMLIIHIKKNKLFVKQSNDLIYESLVSKDFRADSVNYTDDLFSFNERAFNSSIRHNTQVELISTYSRTKEALIRDIKQANKFVYMELTSVNVKDFEEILQSIYDARANDIEIRISFDKHVSFRIVKALKGKGVKVRRYSKHNSYDGLYSNIRNVVVVDGRVAYLLNLNVKNKLLSTKYDIADSTIKLKGDVVQDITLKLCQDLMFSTGKHVDYAIDLENKQDNKAIYQYVTNELDNRVELLLVKAICSAKNTITLELDTFVPSETVMQLLKYAVDSGILVKLMVPIKSTNMSKYYASCAYAKELALIGASVYLYDGYIRFNSILIDNEYAILGGYAIDRVHIGFSSQNMLITNDEKVISYYRRLFDSHINNSYKINDAKYMLLKEKIFKNFI